MMQIKDLNEISILDITYIGVGENTSSDKGPSKMWLSDERWMYYILDTASQTFYLFIYLQSVYFV